jgi:hypothetical protein
MAIATSGCLNVKGVKEAHASFGITGIFRVEKNVTGIKSDESKSTVADTDTTVQIGLFEWKSSAKGVVLGKEER